MATLNQRLYHRIFDAILDGAIAPGTRLTEARLAELYGVSRTVVRRTLQRLCDEGMVDIRQNRGAAVRSIDAHLAREVMQAREVLESGIVEIVCGVLSPRELSRLRRICREEQAAMRAGERARGLRLSSEFHIMLARATGNALLVQYAVNLMSRSALAVACLERREPLHCAFDEHPAIVDALAAGDAAACRESMRSHIAHIRANLALDGEQDDLARVFATDAPARP